MKSTISKHLLSRATIVACLAGATTAGAPAAFGAADGAHASSVSASSASLGRRACPLPKYPGRTGRSVSLTTFHLSCSAGRRISLAHYRCRVKKGRAGYCRAKRVLGYKCIESRLYNRGYYEAKVECTLRQQVSVYVYRQNR
ncbi:MAG: hypothetical protein JWM31_2831 [Solirubrobacterales bacterium]|nr:hypothetical protein [Solirubrobacterales bacterium]